MRKILWCLVLFVQILTWVSATCRLLDYNHRQTGSVITPKSSLPPNSSKQEPEDKMVATLKVENNGGVKKLGSRPPSCEHKCCGCMPCVAMQVPTITSLLGVQFPNYEPESWKCKCGSTFYTP